MPVAVAARRDAPAVGHNVAVSRPVTTAIVRASTLGVVIIGVVAAAVGLHRSGHNAGDDFALYVRQAQSVFEGSMADVLSDNRYTVTTSGGLFGPISYPWGFPLMLSPFVHLWKLDYDKLKLVEVAIFCGFLVLFHGIVRRRINRPVALLAVAVVGLSPLYLRHTDSLLSEFPHMLMVGVVVWWMDRLLVRSSWLTARHRDLVILGLLGALCFNTRREGLVFFGVFAAAQAVEVFGVWRRRPRRASWRRAFDQIDGWTLATPHLAFVGGIVGFHLLMPSMLIPDNDDRLGYIPTRTKDAVNVIADQVGFGLHTAWGAVILAAGAVGAVIACIRRPALHVPLVALTVGSGLMVGTHFRLIPRYYFQITPFVLLYAAFAVIAVVDVVVGALPERSTPSRSDGRDHAQTGVWRSVVGWGLAVVLMAALLPAKVNGLRQQIDDIQAANGTDVPQYGPDHPQLQAIFGAVEGETRADDVVGFFRARLMTLYTDRRTLQTTNLEVMARNADYYAMRKNSVYSQPAVTDLGAARYGMTAVWQDANWILWRFEDAHDAAAEAPGGAGVPDPGLDL